MNINRQYQEISAKPGFQEPAGEAARLLPTDDFDRDVWSILGLPVDLCTAPQAILEIETAVRDRRRLSFVTPNVSFLVRSRADAAARDEIVDADLSLIDGAPLVVLGRLAGVPIRERCAGSDVFEALRRRTGFPGRRLRVFFFGGRKGAAAAAAQSVDLEKRGVEAAGHLDPGHGDVESMSSKEIIDQINASEADFVLVALGAAKGQRWIARNAPRLSAPVVSHLGAVIDFTAGSIRRAPRLVRKMGFEWAWRIKEEPALWRRYFRDGYALGRILLRDWRALLSTRVKGRSPATFAMEVDQAARLVRLKFSGDLTADQRATIRTAFRAALESENNIVLDLANADRLDASFLGLLLMLEKAAKRRGRKVAIANVARKTRRLLAAHGMAYSGETGSDSGSGAGSETIAAAVQSA